MIRNRPEYEAMHAVERSLWWYRILHGKVRRALQPLGPNAALLDAGCGTGGLLEALREAGFTHLTGFDASPDAVEFAQGRGFAVEERLLQDVAGFRSGERFDAIVCNDVFCYLPEAEIVAVLRAFGEKLRPGGLVITNNNAFGAFAGAHDVALRIPKRFVKADFQRFAREAGLREVSGTYWSAALSPLILGVRTAQRLALRLGWLKPDGLHSDVKLPPSWVNQTLYALVRAEERMPGRAPFGSSVFMVLKNDA
jgi:SAM-dependent methyltransferase